MMSAQRRWWLAALLALAVAMLTIEQVIVRISGYAPGVPTSRGPTLPLLLAWAALAALGTAVALRLPARWALRAVLVGLIAVQIGGLTRSVILSSDLYRYAWDGRVQTAGIDPYRYRPVDPALTAQRDRWLFPSPATCADLHASAGCTRINYQDAHTIYPPVAEAEFALVHLLPAQVFPGREHRQQLAADLAALASCLLLIRLLQRAGRHPGWVTLFAWSPLVGLDLASDGHIDGLAVVFVLGALLAWQPRLPRPPGRGPLLAGALVGAAIVTKLYPVLALVAFLRRSDRPETRSRVIGAAASVVVVSYLPHLASVGTHVFGFLPDYLRVEGYDRGSRFLLLSRLGLPGPATKVLAVVILVTVAICALRSDPQRIPAPLAALWVVGAAFLVATPVQPWYGLLLVALAISAGRPEWAAVAIAAYPLYFAAFTHREVLVGSLSYGTAAVLVALGVGCRRRVTAAAARSPAVPSVPSVPAVSSVPSAASVPSAPAGP